MSFTPNLALLGRQCLIGVCTCYRMVLIKFGDVRVLLFTPRISNNIGGGEDSRRPAHHIPVWCQSLK